MNREFLMLAKVFDPAKHDVRGWFMSTKYDGERCLWDGGVSRGKVKRGVPWANTNKPDEVCTGLWSRYGNIIHAPSWWLDKLPCGVLLDGELWSGRGGFQRTRGVVSHKVGGDDWDGVEFLVFDSPSPWNVFCPGRINGPNFKRMLGDECLRWFGGFPRKVLTFEEVLGTMSHVTVGQEKLPKEGAVERVYSRLEEELADGGEGLMLRAPRSVWVPKRVGELLKVKPFEESQGVVTDLTRGEGKYTGKVGALVVMWNGKSFKLSGMTDLERGWGYFNVGDVVKFRYTSLTDGGIPREARYIR